MHTGKKVRHSRPEHSLKSTDKNIWLQRVGIGRRRSFSFSRFERRWRRRTSFVRHGMCGCFARAEASSSSLGRSENPPKRGSREPSMRARNVYEFNNRRVWESSIWDAPANNEPKGKLIDGPREGRGGGGGRAGPGWGGERHRLLDVGSK